MRAVIKFLATLVVVLAIAWVGFWWYAQGRLESGFNSWADGLAAQGWKIGYASEQRGTSPASAVLRFTNLTVTTPPDAQGLGGTFTLPTLALRIQALNPLILHTDLPAKIGVNIGNNIDAAISFASVQATATLDPHIIFKGGDYPYRSEAFSAAGIDILASQGSLLVLHIDSAAGHTAFNPEAGADAMAYAGTDTFSGIAVSPLMTRLLSIPFGGKIDQLTLAVNLSGPVPAGLPQLVAQIKALNGDEPAQQKLAVPVLHKWAAAGGNANIQFGLTVGPTTLAADGAVKFDSSAQPAGTANLTANHLDELTGAITNAYPGTAGTIAQAAAQLSPYLSSTPQDGQMLTLHVVYGAGAVSVNGQKTGDMKPIDWDSLENPAPPPATAPGDGSGADTPDSPDAPAGQ
jgi:hypothetical protein